MLHDVRICFTKIIPLAMAGPEHHPLWRLAELVILFYAVRNASLKHIAICCRFSNAPSVTSKLDHDVRELVYKCSGTQLGAHCSLSLTKDITHVVAGGPNTEKAVQARASGIPVVSPDWLYASGASLSPLARTTLTGSFTHLFGTGTQICSSFAKREQVQAFYGRR